MPARRRTNDDRPWPWWEPRVPAGWRICPRCDLLTTSKNVCGFCAAEVAVGHPVAQMGDVVLGPPDDAVRETVGGMDGTLARIGLMERNRRGIIGNVWEPSVIFGRSGSVMDRLGGAPRPSYYGSARVDATFHKRETR